MMFTSTVIIEFAKFTKQPTEKELFVTLQNNIHLLSLDLIHRKILSMSNPVFAKFKDLLNVLRPVENSAVQFQILVWNASAMFC